MTHNISGDFDLQSLAHALGGVVCNGEVLAPGPGHSPKDQSLSVRPDPAAPDGFIVHSFANDDAIECRDYVRERCGLPAFSPNGNRGPVEIKHVALSRQAVDDAARNSEDLHFHPLANIFPLLQGEQLNALADDIRKCGLHEPVVLHGGQILDGRSRYLACLAVGAACRFKTYEGDDPTAYVVSLNLKRRHLDESQRAMVAAKLVTLKRGDNQHSPIGETSQGRAAELLNVGKRSVERAAAVREHGAPELVYAVETGKIRVSLAADIATESPEQQREIVARGEREILEAARNIRARRAEQGHSERIKKLAKIAQGNGALPTEPRFPVLLADPPWHFEVYNEISGVERAAGNHYPTMSTQAIGALQVSALATDDAVLFLWSTSPHLQEAFQVITEWGFVYKTNIVWLKDGLGLGYYVRNQHELLLIATRGNIPCPTPSRRPPSVFEAARGRHSEKPVEAYQLIERMYPELPKIELFARNSRDGWAMWGNQAPGTVAGSVG